MPPLSPSPSVICRAAEPYVVVYANEEWERLTGWTAADMIGAPPAHEILEMHRPTTSDACLLALVTQAAAFGSCRVRGRARL